MEVPKWLEQVAEMIYNKYESQNKEDYRVRNMTFTIYNPVDDKKYVVLESSELDFMLFDTK